MKSQCALHQEYKANHLFMIFGSCFAQSKSCKTKMFKSFEINLPPSCNPSNYDFDLCLRQAHVKVLSALVMTVSVLLKLPQVVKFLKAKSVRGISETSLYMELIAFTGGTAYSYRNGYPPSYWLERMLLVFQQLLLVAIMLRYTNQKSKAFQLAFLYSAIVTALWLRVVPMQLLTMWIACNMPMLIAGKLMQFRTNYKNKSIGQISESTTYLSVLVCLGRVYTALMETGDRLLVTIASAALFGNALIAYQAIIYKIPEKKAN